MTTLTPPYRYRWNPPLSAVSALIQANWARPCWEYNEALLSYHLDKPGSARGLSLGVESEASGALVGYQAHMPLDIELHGQRLRAVFASFLTVAPETRGANIALPLQVALLEHAQRSDVPVYLTMCEVGALSNLSLKMVCKAIARPLQKLRIIRYAAAFRGSVAARLAAASGRTRPYGQGDEASLADLLARDRKPVALRQCHHREDFAYRFPGADNRCTFVYEVDGALAGLIHVLVLRVLDRARDYRNAYIQDLVVDGLSPSDCRAFINDVLAHLTMLPIEAIYVPDTGRVDDLPWKAWGFRPMSRGINLYGVPLEPALGASLADIGTFDLDVY